VVIVITRPGIKTRGYATDNSQEWQTRYC